MGLLDRLIKPFTKSNDAVKSVALYSSNDDLYYNPGYVGKDYHLARTDYGAATAAVIQEDIFACLEARVNALNGLKWELRRYNDTTIQEDDEVLCTSEDQAPRYPLAKAINRFRQKNGFDFFATWYYSALVTGKMFIEPQKDVLGLAYRQLQWYNPTGMTIQEFNGQITEFLYYGDGQSLRFAPDEIIYDRKLNLLNENIGMSPVMAAIDSINLDRTYKQQLSNFFQNAMQLGHIFSVKGVSQDGIVYPENKRREIVNKMRRENQGNRNAGKDLWLEDLVEVTTPQQPNLQQNDAAIERASNRVHKVLRTPRAITGDMSEMPYQQHKDMYDSWMDLVILPDAYHIARVVNDQLLDLFEEGDSTYFAFDDSKWRKRLTENDIQRQQLSERHLKLGTIDVNQYQKMNNLDVDGNAKDLRYMPTDVLVVTSYDDATIDKVQATQQAQLETIEEPVEADVVDVVSDESKAEDELEAWRKFARKPHRRDFSFRELDSALASEINERHKAGDDVDAIYNDVKPLLKMVSWRGDAIFHARLLIKEGASFDDAHKAVKARLDGIKAQQATRLEFENRFEDVLREAAAGTLTRGRLGTIMRSLLSRYGRMLYVDGLVDGGVTGGELDTEDEAKIKALERENSGYVSEFTNEVVNGSGLTRDQIDAKMQAWWNKSLKPFYDAGILSANDNIMLEFAGDDGVESCQTCIVLKGQRHRAKEWARRELRPGIDTENYGCGGWQCEHVLVPTKERARGKLPSESQIRAWAAKEHTHKHVTADEIDFKKQPYTRAQYDAYYVSKGYTV